MSLAGPLNCTDSELCTYLQALGDCWLMGWPTQWTALAPLDRDKFHEWWSKHGGC